MSTKVAIPLVALALAGSLLFARANRATAAGSAATNLDVVASVNIACTIAAVPVSFGNYDPSGANAAAPLDATGGVSVNCTTNGGNVRVSLGQGQFPGPGSTNNVPRRRMGHAASRLSYNLYSDAAHSAVWDNNAGVKTGKIFPVLMTVYGRVPAAQMVPSGAYADTILATVTF
ncbi:MAG: spore coat U domain-containing protein [Polyangiales bacterium]